jgi:hypothetical protein
VRRWSVLLSLSLLMAISSTFDGDFLLETKHETPNKGFHVKTNQDGFFFHELPSQEFRKMIFTKS